LARDPLLVGGLSSGPPRSL